MSYLTAKMLQKQFGVSRRTLYSWVKAGVLPMPAKFGRDCYWNADEIKAAFDRQRAVANPQHSELSSRNLATVTKY